MSVSPKHQIQEEPETASGAAVQDNSRKPNMAAEIWDWIKSISVALIIVIVLNLYVFNLSTVKGHSMEPTLQEKEWLFINKIVYITGSPKRGDVVILKDPVKQEVDRKFLVKRVVGLPGDRVEIRSGKLYVNGDIVQEPYTDIRIEDGDHGPFVVEEGRYFVMGDNRHQGASLDSRSFGSVASGLIEGRADFILWPMGKAGTL
ncbi:MAG: signal peptidase [Paenibacillus sp.]|nr:signal peptidase [Paenibacillus sp.]